MNSHAKGKRFELEIAAKLREMGYEARRTQQYSGKTEEASDVVGLNGIHIECKHQEQMRLYDWMAQAERDAKDTLPAVFHKQNRKPILVTMKFEDWMKLYEEYEVHQ